MSYQIRSSYIKNLIKGKSFKNPKFRDYINELLFLEHGILDGIAGMAGNLKFFGVKGEYEEEYLELLKELNPKCYCRELKELKKEELEQKRVEEWNKREERKEQKEQEEAWMKAGGEI